MADSAVNINDIAAAVARQLSTSTGKPAEIVVQPAASLGAVNGSVDIAIVVGGTTYTLTVQSPSTENNGEFVFSLTMTPQGGKAQDLGSFKFKDSSDWSVKVGIPPITIGSVTIQTFDIQVGMGST